MACSDKEAKAPNQEISGIRVKQLVDSLDQARRHSDVLIKSKIDSSSWEEIDYDGDFEVYVKKDKGTYTLFSWYEYCAPEIRYYFYNDQLFAIKETSRFGFGPGDVRQIDAEIYGKQFLFSETSYEHYHSSGIYDLTTTNFYGHNDKKFVRKTKRMIRGKFSSNNNYTDFYKGKMQLIANSRDWIVRIQKYYDTYKTIE
jgi:hypothetical protein